MLTMADPAPVDQSELDRLLQPLGAAAKLVLAVSGGPDSVVLMRLTARWLRAGKRPEVVVATVDHQLRKGSAAEAVLVASWANELGFEHQILQWEGEKPLSRIQEAARAARYCLLTRFAQQVGASHLVTAHTLDDQAETILFRLVRGSGPLGLVGIRPLVMRSDIALIRPLLSVPKTWLVAVAKTMGWAYIDDPSNSDPRFARTRLRALMPELAKEGLSAQRLTRLAGRMQAIAVAIESVAREVQAAALIEAAPTRQVYELAGVMGQPAAILAQVLAMALRQLRGNKDGSYGPPLERLEALVERLQSAYRDGRRFRQTLAGATISLESDHLILIPEPGRRRGMLTNRSLC
jgi:tRNA(Ile)-lysidine synthase